jgi:hypothetical protein
MRDGVIPFSERFAAIAAWDVLEHIPIDDIALQVRERLVPGSIFAFAVPVYDGRWAGCEPARQGRHPHQSLPAPLLARPGRASFRARRLVRRLLPAARRVLHPLGESPLRNQSPAGRRRRRR